MVAEVLRACRMMCFRLEAPCTRWVTHHRPFLVLYGLQVLTGKSPCHRGPNGKWLQMRSIINHEQPFLPRPPQISPALWGIIQKCWVSEPQDRATMAEVVTKLRDLVVHEQ